MGKFDDISLKPGDFGSTASTHTILTSLELEELFPTEQEKKKFKDLLTAVEAATQDNQKKAKLIADIARYGEVVFKLLSKAIVRI